MSAVNFYYLDANLSLLTPEEAGEGRKFLTPVYRGYRSAHFCISGTEWPEWIARFSPVDREVLQPGETGPVVVHLLNSAFPREQLWVGREFGLCLAGKVLGHGTITAIRDLDARAHTLLGVNPKRL